MMYRSEQQQQWRGTGACYNAQQGMAQRPAWFFLFFILASALAVLSGCGNEEKQESTPPTGTISGVVKGTIIVAVNAKNEVLATVEAEGEPGNKTFTLDGIPLNEPVSLYLITDGNTYPMLLKEGSKDTFQLSSSTPLELGLITIDPDHHTAKPTFEPSEADISNDDKRSTIPHTLNDPNAWGILGRSVDDLLEKGMGAARTQWAAGAYAHFQQANIRAKGQDSANKTRFLQAFSRLIAMAMDTRYDGTSSDLNRVGDFLYRFGCDNDSNPSLLFKDFICPESWPATAPVGEDFNDFFVKVVATELKSSLSTLEEITDSHFSTRWVGLDLNQNGHLEENEPLGTWLDANGDSIIDSGELGSKITWDSGSIPKEKALHRVDIDYGDILIFKAWLRYGLAQIRINQAYHWETSLYESQGLSAEQWLVRHPDAATLSHDANSHLAAAKRLLSQAADDLLGAVDAIQGETDGQGVDLFTIDANEVPKTKQFLENVKSSLDVATTFEENSRQVTLDFARFFEGLNLRIMIPPLKENAWDGLFPDATLGGVIVSGKEINEDLNGNNIPDILENDLSVRGGQ